MASKYVYTILVNNTDVNSVVSGRIYPLRAPEGADWPFITYQVIDNQSLKTDSGPSELDKKTYQINCMAETQAGVDDLYNKVRVALDGYTGTVDSVKIGYCGYEDETDLFDQDTEKPGIAIDFEFDVYR